jgi:hypothetical protein
LGAGDATGAGAAGAGVGAVTGAAVMAGKAGGTWLTGTGSWEGIAGVACGAGNVLDAGGCGSGFGGSGGRKS